ncbi:RNA methyltransferase [Candidatus Methylospira mobilis]|uniref:RNA methyltransferase n=1 Tax=Candidatus Methylospira mobilis TaxID=1808979 RepID=A0A5Q0BMM0_9GAMM|nr:RNA methyltransferase [Candidatus Methylospira mobilis]
MAKISGFAAVSALFKHEPLRVMRLYYEERAKHQVGGWCAQMAKNRRPYRCVEEDELTRIAGTVLHGGVVAAAMPRAVYDLNFETAKSWAKAGQHLFILDGVGNPHNLGAIARSLAFFGIRHLALSDHPEQSGISDAAHRVAEGGLEELSIDRIKHLPDAIGKLRPYYHVVGTSLGGKAQPLTALGGIFRPIALILGNEEHGLPQATQKACDTLVTIPALGNMQSLNVSASAAIFAYELTRRFAPTAGR